MSAAMKDESRLAQAQAWLSHGSGTLHRLNRSGANLENPWQLDSFVSANDSHLSDKLSIVWCRAVLPMTKLLLKGYWKATVRRHWYCREI
jgi:hypothetical protein